MWEERSIMFDNNLCRLCGSSSDNLFSIQGANENESATIIALIQRLTPLKIELKDGKPQQICQTCISALENFDAFISMCVATDIALNNLLQNVKPIQNITKDNLENGIMWVKERKDQIATDPSNSILLLSQTNDNSTIQNQDFYVMLELDCRSVDIDPLIIQCNDKSKTSIKSSNEESKNSIHVVKCLELVDDSNRSLKAHLAALKKKKESSQLYKCNICSKSLTRKSNLITHLALHSEDRPHKCSECGKNFAVSTDLTLHKHIHTRSFACGFCKKCFVTKSKLERHKKSHSGVKDHKCPICDKSFAEKTNMTAHLTVHTGERPFSCTVCQKSFRTQSHLTDHKKVHSSDTPYKCNMCTKSFKWKTNLKDHSKFHSGEKFKCMNCLKEFGVRTDYYKHRKDCKKIKKMFSCKFCFEKFDNELQHQSHIETIHKNESF